MHIISERPLILLLTLALAGCTGDPNADEDSSGDATETETTAGETTTGETTGETGETTQGETTDTGGSPLDCVDEDFMAQPFMGPGYDAEAGEIIGPVQDSYVAHTTQLALTDDPDALQVFGGHVAAIEEALATQEGLIGYSLGSSESCGTARTLAVWTSEEAMMAFAVGDAHAAAVADTAVFSTTGRVHHWTIPADEVPLTWEAAQAAIADVPPSY